MTVPSSPLLPAAPAWTNFFLGEDESCSRPGKSRRAGRQRCSADDRSGTVLADQWELLRRLGQGGMGEVYEAFYRGDRQRYAVKILSPRHRDEAVTRERFRHEYLALRQMGVAGVVEAHALYGEGDELFYSMELLAGQDLAALNRERSIPAIEVIDIGLQLCSTLGEIHAHGVIHRDVKPNNVVRLPDGRVKLVDLGIGKLLPAFYAEGEARTPPEKRLMTAPGIKLGTPGYVAPEAGLGEAPTPATDVFSLGVTLFRLATGRMPFPPGRPVNIGDEPRLAAELQVELPPALESVLRRAMITNPRHRLPSMSALAEELDLAREELLAVTPHERQGVTRSAPAPLSGIQSGPSSRPAYATRNRQIPPWLRNAGLLLGGLLLGALGSRLTVNTSETEAMARSITLARVLQAQLDDPPESTPALHAPAHLRSDAPHSPPPTPRNADEEQAQASTNPTTSPTSPTMSEVLDRAEPELQRCAKVAGGLMILRLATEANAGEFTELAPLGSSDERVEHCVRATLGGQRFKPEPQQVFLRDYQGDADE